MKKTAVIALTAVSALLAGPSAQADVIAPAGLNPGDEFRIMFRTSGTHNATSSDILVYDAFITAAALAGGLTTYGGNPVTWQVFGATPTVTGISRIPLLSPAFYRVDGTLIATSGSDLWDGFIANPIDRTETGAVVANNRVWSGINNPDGHWVEQTLTEPQPVKRMLSERLVNGSVAVLKTATISTPFTGFPKS